MAFCINCGAQNADGARFCIGCGKAVAGAAAPEQAAALPAKEKVGNIRTCPACGETVGSFQARCSSCGHEFTTVKTASSVQKFSEEISQIEVKEVEDLKEKTEFAALAQSAGAAAAAFLFVAIFVAGEGLLIIAYVPAVLAGIFAFPRIKLSESENQVKKLVENFTVPNTREDLLEFLILASSRIEEAHGFSSTARRQRLWNKIWLTKCKQLQGKIDIAFAGDSQSLGIARGIQDRANQTIAAVKKRGTIMIAALAVLLAIPGIIMTVADRTPEPRILQAEELMMAGAMGSSFRVVGGGHAEVVGSRESPRLALTLEVEALESIGPLVEQRVADAIAARGWGANDDIRRSVGFSPATLAGLRSGERDVAGMLNMEAGDTANVRFYFRGDGRRDLFRAMRSSVFIVNLAPSIQLVNNSVTSRRHADRNQTVRF